MSELGQKFKAAREKRGISIQEVGLSLKINPRVIAAIENGERETLPARTFLRGFVKSYAQFLRMDVKDLMEEFQKEYGGGEAAAAAAAAVAKPGSEGGTTEPNPTSMAASTPEAPPAPRSLADSPSIAKDNISEEPRFPVGKVLLGVVLFAMVIFLAKTVNKYQKERVLPEDGTEVSEATDETPDGLSLTTGTLGEDAPTGTTPNMDGITAITAVTAVTAISSPVSTPTPTTTPSPTPSPTPTATPSPTPSPTPTSTPRPSPSPSPSPTTPPRTNSTGASEILPRPVEVMVETNKAVRVRYDLGNGQWTTLDLAAGAIHTFRSKSPISLDIADGGALNLIVNGRDRGKPGPTGQPVQLRLRE